MTAGRPGSPRALPPTERQWCVYRCFDASGQLLYVGSSSDVDNRIYRHFSPHVSQVASLELQRLYARHEVVLYSTKAEALDQERRAIRLEAPLLNRVNNPRRWRFFGQQWSRVEDDLGAAGAVITSHDSSTYSNHGCRCADCRKSHADRTREARARRRERLTADDPRHGSANTYNNHGCRCWPCKYADAVARGVLPEPTRTGVSA